MIIKYPYKHSWCRTLSKDPFAGLSKSVVIKLKATLSKIDTSTVTHEIKPLTKETIDWFVPLYTEAIENKANARVFDIYSTTIGKGSKFSYFSLTLIEDNTPIGALIFSERNEKISIAYKFYPHDWKVNTLKASPSFYAEYLLIQHAINNGFSKLSHGKDRNPYGLNSAIGLAVFKLSVGCSPHIPKNDFVENEIDLACIDTDILVLTSPLSGTQITEAILYTSPESVEKYTQVTKYPEQLKVTVIERK